MPKSKQFRTVGSLDSLADLSNQLRSEREREEAQALLKAQAEAEAKREAELFKEFVKDVKPLQNLNIQYIEPQRPEPLPRQTTDFELPSQSDLSDNWVSPLISNEESPYHFRRDGVGIETLRKLHKGQWRVQAELDLHGFTTDEAREAIFIFIKSCTEQNLRCIRVIHGKGLSSQDNTPILKNRVVQWLTQLPKVIAFCPPSEREGGDGALFVLLKAPKSNRHKR